jgi:hypothetical protein
VLKLMDSPADRHIVQIFNNDQSRIIDTVLAIPNYRLQPTGHSQFAFWETPPGNAKALRAWFYPGDNFGQEFPYPKHFIQLEASAASSMTTMPAVPTTTMTEEAAPVTQPTEPQNMTQETQKDVEVEQQEEIAQATPPQTTPAPPPTTVDTTPQEPSANREAPEMPKTGSLYPLIGLCGLLSLGVYGLFRLKRTA